MTPAKLSSTHGMGLMSIGFIQGSAFGPAKISHAKGRSYEIEFILRPEIFPQSQIWSYCSNSVIDF